MTVPPSKCPKIWVIDDSPADHELMRIAFKPYMPVDNISSYYSAEEAVEELKQGKHPSLILLDLNMPGQGGTFFLKERQSRLFMHVPVVILTSSSNPDDIRETYAAGANSYLLKPADLTELEAFAENVYSYWFRFAYLPQDVC